MTDVPDTAAPRLLRSLQGDVTVLTMNRPDVMNALDRDLRMAIAQAVTEAGKSARSIVLTGSGRAFCSGQDLRDAGDLSPERVRAILAEEYEPMLRAITDCPVPVIAAVNGTAAGAGANLALACDLVIAAESASFIQAFTRIGLMPDAGGTWILPRLIGHARVLGAMLLADAIPARQAADWGMIWQAVADADFAATWQTAAHRLAVGPTQAYRALRQAVRASAVNGLDTQLALESRLQGDCAATADFAEGLVAFSAKRPPVFRGR